MGSIGVRIGLCACFIGVYVWVLYRAVRYRAVCVLNQTSMCVCFIGLCLCVCLIRRCL